MSDFGSKRFGILNPGSLRGRYLLVSAFLGLLIVFSATLFDYFVTATKASHLRNMEGRSQAASQNRILRSATREVERRIESFMWTPSPQAREGVHQALDAAVEQVKILSALPWLGEVDLHTPLPRAHSDLHRLRAQLDHLMDTRVDKELQFPALKLMREQSNPSHLAYMAAVDLAIQEAGTETIDRALERELVQLRSDWLVIVAQFRLYIANRIGVLFEQRLAAQKQDIEQLHRAVTERLALLEATRDRGTLPLEIVDSVQRMREAADHWYEAYLAIRAIDDANDWRTDAPFLKGTVEPAFAKLWNDMEALDVMLEAETQNDVYKLQHAGAALVRALWGIAILGLASMVVGFIFFERTVLSPIAMVARALNAEASGKRDAVLPRADNEETAHLVDAFAKMRHQVQERQQALEYQSLHDALTALPNRRLMADRMQQAIFSVQRFGGSLALLMLDLDGFKEINDTLGHATGDDLLRCLGERLAQLFRQSDTVARLGGDEFAVLLPQADRSEAITVAHKILKTLEQSFDVADQPLYVSCSIGIALHPEHASDPEELSRCADVAMYVAKKNKNSYAVYDPSQDGDSLRRLSLATALRDAINSDALRLVYQPQVRIATYEFTGFEVLLRWEHPERGSISPDEFIPVAEQTGLIRPLTYWVLDNAFKQCAQWRATGFDYRRIAVNLSVFNLQDPALVERIRSGLTRWDTPPEHLTLELTESAMMADSARATKLMEHLRDLGVRLAIDDFGTGFSSLTYLKRLSVHELKIDKSFIVEMAEDENDAVIVRSTIELAHNLGLEVVAEGVENQDALDLLRILNCDSGQGFFISKPMAAEQIEAWARQTIRPHRRYGS